MYKYFSNLKFTPVYSASLGGLNFKIAWDGFKLFLRNRF